MINNFSYVRNLSSAYSRFQGCKIVLKEVLKIFDSRFQECVICKTFRLCGIRHELLMKLNQGDVEKIVKRVVDYGLSTAFVAGQFGVTQRRVQQLVKHYRERRLARFLYSKNPGGSLMLSIQRTSGMKYCGRRQS